MGERLFECKICGGDLIAIPGVRLGQCDSCGSTQPMPMITGDEKTMLYNRANQYRMTHDYKLAINEFESVLKEDPYDADVYWNIALCKHEIEYVEDPNNAKMVPTCNRLVSSSILEDPDYKKALELADITTRSLYEKEAVVIDSIEQKTREVYDEEEPYDIFICYKEKNPKGGRTEDSVLAEHLYDLLKPNYRVFFSMISLTEKLGAEYEPYIYHALQTAKVMVLVTTSKENVESRWLKNEWSRFLKVIEKNHNKRLIIAYKDTDPGTFPGELTRMQGVDIGRIGGEEDLIRGIRSILGTGKSNNNKLVEVKNGILPADRLYENGQTNLKLGEMSAAESCFKDMTKYYPEDWRGWWGEVLTSTNNLKNIDAYRARDNQIGKCFINAKELAPEIQFKEMEDSFSDYLDKVADFDVSDVIDDIKRKKDYFRGAIDAAKDAISVTERKIEGLYLERDTNKDGTKPDFGIDSHISLLKKEQAANNTIVFGYSSMAALYILSFYLMLSKPGLENIGLLIFFGLTGVLIVMGLSGSKYGKWSAITVIISTIIAIILNIDGYVTLAPISFLSLIVILNRVMLNSSIGKQIKEWEEKRPAERAAINNWHRSFDDKVAKSKEEIHILNLEINDLKEKICSLESYMDCKKEIKNYFWQKKCCHVGIKKGVDLKLEEQWAQIQRIINEDD